MKNDCLSMADLLPDSGADYETEFRPEMFQRNMRVTHYYCPETKEMQPLKYWLDKTIKTYYNELGGSD